MNQEQTNITTGKQIRHLRTQLGMTQEELAGELNVTRQALSNWERDVNEPDLNMLKKICFLFGVNMDDFAKEVITKMETYEKKEKRQFNKYDMAIGLFYGVGIFLGILPSKLTLSYSCKLFASEPTNFSPWDKIFNMSFKALLHS